MKKLNNKGFAFSTIMYGLAILGIMVVLLMMSIMQTNRQNNKKFVEEIENDLNNFNLTQRVFVPKVDDQSYTVPKGQAGWYIIEVWGGANGSTLSDYAAGIIRLNESEKIIFKVELTGSKSSYVKNTSGSKIIHAGGANNNETMVGSRFERPLIIKKTFNRTNKARIRRISTDKPAIPANITNGNYYIFAPGSERKVLESRGTNGNVETANFTGDNTQVWNIEALGGNYYKITNVATGNVMQISSGTNDAGILITANSPYTGAGYGWEKWQLNKHSSNYYYFETTFDNATSTSSDTATVTLSLKDLTADASTQLVTSRSEKTAFKFVNVDNLG